MAGNKGGGHNCRARDLLSLALATPHLIRTAFTLNTIRIIFADPREDSRVWGVLNARSHRELEGVAQSVRDAAVISCHSCRYKQYHVLKEHTVYTRERGYN